MRPLPLALSLAILIGPVVSTAQSSPELGLSSHGSAFDTGLRTKPWRMEGLGTAPFEITAKSQEVQDWFNQGNELMHSFWFEEAERTFRWCLKLDPDNPMVYWALAYTGFNWFVQNNPKDPGFDRYREFLKQAVKRKDKASARERMYIEAWASAFAPEASDSGQILASELQKIVLAYPDDIEAKALLAFYNIGRGSAFANQLIVDEILKVNPNHPGAYHASIHNWDGVDPIRALASCERYGKVAPGVGHSLHMPGHIYTKVGMWHEAAWAMDSATRVELRYMNDRLALPFETWNFSHNRNYLCYIQEQLGMEKAALQGARDMLNAPRDPDRNPEQGDYYYQGMAALVRGLMKFERWSEILRPGAIPWRNDEDSKSWRAYAETVACAASGQLLEAQEKLSELKALTAPHLKDAGQADRFRMPLREAEGRLAIAEGRFLDGSQALLEAAKIEDSLGYGGDPPQDPWTLWRIVGDAYREHGELDLAIDAYGRALKKEANDAFTLSGLARCYDAKGEEDKAADYAGKFLKVWTNADPALPWSNYVKEISTRAEPFTKGERPYSPAALDRLGPSNWSPFPAPDLNVVDSEGAKVDLGAYRGKNVILVFYLSDQCAHCMQQLQQLSSRKDELASANTEVLAVCNTPASKPGPMEGVRLLWDTDHKNARKFASYDDFEEMELHSTILIDSSGRVRWKRSGGDPFTNIDFLIGEIKQFRASP